MAPALRLDVDGRSQARTVPRVERYAPPRPPRMGQVEVDLVAGAAGTAEDCPLRRLSDQVDAARTEPRRQVRAHGHADRARDQADQRGIAQRARWPPDQLV